MISTLFCIVRHGETNWNRESRLQGNVDIPLNATGHKQAQQLDYALRAFSFNALYTSPLCRAIDTALPVHTRTGLPLTPLDGLLERNMGIFQGLSYTEAEKRMPEKLQRFRSREPDYDLDGGESLITLEQRVKSCLEALAHKHPKQMLLVITHGGILDIVYRLATQKPLYTQRDVSIHNTAINWIEYRQPIWHIQEWANEQHLHIKLDEIV